MPVCDSCQRVLGNGHILCGGSLREGSREAVRSGHERLFCGCGFVELAVAFYGVITHGREHAVLGREEVARLVAREVVEEQICVSVHREVDRVVIVFCIFRICSHPAVGRTHCAERPVARLDYVALGVTVSESAPVVGSHILDVEIDFDGLGSAGLKHARLLEAEQLHVRLLDGSVGRIVRSGAVQLYGLLACHAADVGDLHRYGAALYFGFVAGGGLDVHLCERTAVFKRAFIQRDTRDFVRKVGTVAQAVAERIDDRVPIPFGAGIVIDVIRRIHIRGLGFVIPVIAVDILFVVDTEDAVRIGSCGRASAAACGSIIVDIIAGGRIAVAIRVTVSDFGQYCVCVCCLGNTVLIESHGVIIRIDLVVEADVLPDRIGGVVLDVDLIGLARRIRVARNDIRHTLETYGAGTADHKYAVDVRIVFEVIVLDGNDRVDEIYDLLEALLLYVFEQRFFLVGQHKLVLIRFALVLVGRKVCMPVAFGVLEHLFFRSRSPFRAYALSVKHGIVIAGTGTLGKISRHGNERDIFVLGERTLDRRRELGYFVPALCRGAVFMICVERFERGIYSITLFGQRLRHAGHLPVDCHRAPSRSGRALQSIRTYAEHAHVLRPCDGKRVVAVFQKYRSLLSHLNVQFLGCLLRFCGGLVIGIKITVILHRTERGSGSGIAGNKKSHDYRQYEGEHYRQKGKTSRHFPFFHFGKPPVNFL